MYGSWDQFDDNTFCSKEYRVVFDWLLDNDKVKYPKVDWDWDNPTPFMQRSRQKRINKKDSKDSDLKNVHDFGNLSQDLLYAPDAIYRDGKYYLYFCALDDSEGVALQTDLTLSAKGSGEIKIYLDGGIKESGHVIVSEGIIVTSTFSGPSGKYEIKLEFDKSKNLELHSIQFS
ncbi:hypothetical protein [Paenibacillus sp. HW567]|uniref:hypothetical protein n=1 Tax=Paenibacillus sp. HW567 TaxID=1034769 RepID=UPI00037A1D06|nr:hypothetical protein [Paenibacillus sp. HW567]